MTLRYVVLPILLLLLFNGCAHFATTPSDSTEATQMQETAASAYSDVTSDKILHNGQLIDSADISASDLQAASEGQTDAGVANGEDVVANLGTQSGRLGLDPVSTQKIQTDLDEALEL